MIPAKTETGIVSQFAKYLTNHCEIIDFCSKGVNIFTQMEPEHVNILYNTNKNPRFRLKRRLPDCEDLQISPVGFPVPIRLQYSNLHLAFCLKANVILMNLHHTHSDDQIPIAAVQTSSLLVPLGHI